MKLLLDACVLYPTVMREMLLGCAARGLFVPLWSDRLLEEWARAAARRGAVEEMQARGEIALVKAAFDGACIPAQPGLETRLWLPDDNDIHVLAVAVAGFADGIVTLNAKDFPRNILREEGLERHDPDALVMGFWQNAPDAVTSVGLDVLARANSFSASTWDMRALLKKARMPRIAKALAGLS